jgi:hypothetical protein
MVKKMKDKNQITKFNLKCDKCKVTDGLQVTVRLDDTRTVRCRKHRE